MFQSQRDTKTKLGESWGVLSPGLQIECVTAGLGLGFQVSGSPGTRGLCSAWVPGGPEILSSQHSLIFPSLHVQSGERTHPGTLTCSVSRVVRGYGRGTCLQLQSWGEKYHTEDKV